MPAVIPTTLVLARHGQTPWHQENRYAGSSDIGLTETGFEQAARLGEWAARHRPDVLYVSPRLRAKLTIAPAEAATGLTATVIGELAEPDFGIVEGRTIDEVMAIDPAAVAAYDADPIDGNFPGADDLRVAGEAAVAALHRMVSDHPGATVLAVAHNTLIRLALCLTLGIDLHRYRELLPRIDNVALTTVRSTDRGSLALLSYNVPLSGRGSENPQDRNDRRAATIEH